MLRNFEFCSGAPAKPAAKASERGAIILVLTVMLVGLIGAMGLALDAARLYETKQRAQAAADAAAQAGIMDLFNMVGQPAAAGTAASTAVSYAEMNGFQAGEVNVNTSLTCSSQSWCKDHVRLSGETPNLLEVTITRSVNTTFMRILGPTVTTVSAVADAAIVIAPGPPPIIITHPTLSGSFQLGGTSDIIVCGGPARSIQVNSNSASALRVGGSALVDLSHAGPADTGYNCTTGTGADFAALGGPTYSGTPGWLNPGTTGRFWQPASVIYDPLDSISAPIKPPNVVNPNGQPILDGTQGCPASPVKPCALYSPGAYPGGIHVQNQTAIFAPGLYYMDNGADFSSAAHGYMYMCSGCAADPVTGSGMVVYNHGGGSFNVGANGDVTLIGSDYTSAYKGILFFGDRSAPGITQHQLGGGGALSLTGTLYLTNCDANDPNCSASPKMSGGVYQVLNFNGGSGSSTNVFGYIIASTLSMQGNTIITMHLDPNLVQPMRSVALVR